MRLSRDVSTLEPHYDAVVVGSGYGGGVAASRLSRMGLKVAVLERGREFETGDFPDTILEATEQLQTSLGPVHTGSRLGLFDLRLGRDIHVLVGCGLGGTSLINANVSLPPDPRVWEDAAWPIELVGDDTLEEGYKRALRMLRPQSYPNAGRFGPLTKLDRLATAATAVGGTLSLPPINVAFATGPNAANVVQPECTGCGDCCSGCNVGAKTTVQMTYLPDALNHGAHIVTEATVRSVRKDARGGWRIIYEATRRRAPGFAPEARSLTAGIVVLAAGSLGSTEILLRSKAEGLAVSPRLGERFTGNGDVLAFAYNNDLPVNGVGVGHPRRSGLTPPGPCIAGAVDLRASDSLEDGMIIEEGVLPSGLAPVLPGLFAAGAQLTGVDADRGFINSLHERERGLKSLLLGSYAGAIHNTQTFLVMAHDDAGGRIGLEADHVAVEWPGVAGQGVYARIEETLTKASGANGGTYIRNPLQSTEIIGKTLVTVHPLGGCVMGANAGRGVVNHRCQVFDASPGAAPGAVHDGLYVCDGAVLSRPLGVNPLLTISALSERAMIHLAAERHADLSDAPKADAPLRRLSGSDGGTRDRAVGAEFTERMGGFISALVDRTHEDAADEGRRKGIAFSFLTTIVIDDIDAFVRDSNHAGRITGTVTCAALSAEPMDILDGVFNLMRPDPDRVETRRFDYRMRLASREGRTFDFIGFKLVRSDRQHDLGRDTTTLFIDVAETTPAAPPRQARGVLKISLLDFARQLMTVRGKGGTPQQNLAAVAKFGKVFAGSLFDVYGGLFRPSERYDASVVRTRRELRTSPPERHEFMTKDGKKLRLTRYNGGGKGPVLFSHGLGVSSHIFTIDTIDTNLLEAMYSAGYDCWLLDFRASIDLPYCRERWTGDDCARFDYQPAVDLIRSVAKVPSVQVIAHCFGATTFVMALLGGHLSGVRSAVISQIATDVIVPWFPQRLLAQLRAPALFDLLRIDAVNARATRQDGLNQRLVDALIRLFVPIQREERVRNATSRRISALYGQLYETDQLNDATFSLGLAEMFGPANIDAFKHLALIARRQVIVDAQGRDSYLPNLDRMSLPICFIHGAENACFSPESTARTLDRLQRRNADIPYERHVIPNYGHIDCIFGKTAAVDVYPIVVRYLDRMATP